MIFTNNLSLSLEISAANYFLKEYTDYIMIRDSLSLRNKVKILHPFNEIELVVAVPRSKIKDFPTELFDSNNLKREAPDFESFKSRGDILFGKEDKEANLVTREKSLSSVQRFFSSLNVFPRFIYQIVESESFLDFSLLKENSSLIWYERGRVANRTEGYGFNGEKVYVDLTKKSSAVNGIDLYIQPPLANSSRGKVYYGGLQTTLLLPGIIAHEKEEGLVKKLHDQVWDNFMEQYSREIKGAPDYSKYHPLNVFSTRNRGGWEIEGEKYVDERFKYYCRKILSKEN